MYVHISVIYVCLSIICPSIYPSNNHHLLPVYLPTSYVCLSLIYLPVYPPITHLSIHLSSTYHLPIYLPNLSARPLGQSRALASGTGAGCCVAPGDRTGLVPFLFLLQGLTTFQVFPASAPGALE